MQNFTSSSFKDTVAGDNMFAMSSGTKKLQEKALKMTDKANEYAEKAANGSNWIWPFSMAQNAYWESQADKYANKSINAIDKYESAKASDSIWIKAREAVGLEGANLSKDFTKYSWIIFVAIVIGLVILFKMLKNKRKATKAHAKAEKIAAKRGNLTVVEAPQPAAIDTSQAQAVLVDRDMEKSIKSCKKYCEKYGIDYDTYLAQYNGDPKALLDFLISSSAEDFQ